MRIAIEALGIHRYGGGRSAIINLLNALLQIDTKNHYDLLLSQYEPSLVIEKQVNQFLCPFRNRILARFWLQLVIPLQQKKWNLIHFTKNLGTFGHSIPTIVTIHDLTTVLYPDIFPRLDVWYWKHIEKLTAEKADKLIAVSKTTARDIETIYAIPAEKIQVIYHGLAPNFHPATSEEIRSIKRKYKLSNDYLLYIGRIDRKKNLPMLIRAFSEFRNHSSFTGKLVIVGEEYEKTRENTIYDLIEELELTDKTIFTGLVPDVDLPAIYSGAIATLFPSYHEGFGLVALEAMGCGSPLIASDAGAIREVTAGAAKIVSSIDSTHFARAIIDVTADSLLQQQMRQKGLARAANFTWEDAAENTLRLYEKYSR